ncbi:MAG: flagellar basal body L-ring protein FlgH [Pirellulales bacterium]|nr:flagellar basal body L-ring protein FlgH [Pirellulales bacterium]
MNRTKNIVKAVGSSIVAVTTLAFITHVRAQDSSLSERQLPVTGPRILTLEETSFTYQKPLPARTFQLEDIVFIRVDIKAEFHSDAILKRDKDASVDASLLDWVKFDGWSLKPAPQRDGDPTVRGELDKEYNAKGRLNQRDRIAFNIAARVVDIRPNGHLVLESHRTIRNNNEIWDASLSGIVRPDDIDQGNMVMSERVSELRIDKRERGTIRDSYRRGWITRMIESVKLF